MADAGLGIVAVFMMAHTPGGLGGVQVEPSPRGNGYISPTRLPGTPYQTVLDAQTELKAAASVTKNAREAVTLDGHGK